MTDTGACSVQTVKGHLLCCIIISDQEQFTGVLLTGTSGTSSSTSNRDVLLHLHFTFTSDVSDAFFLGPVCFFKHLRLLVH